MPNFNNNIPPQKVEGIQPKDKLTGERLSQVSHALNRLMGGVNFPKQMFRNPSGADAVSGVARLQFSVAGSLSGLSAIDGVTPSAGDIILVSQGAPTTDGLYTAASGAWTAIFLVSNLPDGFTVNVYDGNSSPLIYMVQG